MDTAIYAVIFLLGGVGTVIVMRLLFLFWNRPFKRSKTTGIWSRSPTPCN